MNVTVFPCGPAANESELKAIEHLKSRLQSEAGNGDWVLLTNLAFSVTHQFQSDEIDIIAIGEKDYVGYIPTRRTFRYPERRRGHEVNTSTWAKLEPDALDQIVAKTNTILHRMFQPRKSAGRHVAWVSVAIEWPQKTWSKPRNDTRSSTW